MDQEQPRRALSPEQRQEVLDAIVPFKGRSVDLDREVRVYRNLHAAEEALRWSIQQRIAGRWYVVGHARRLMLRDATFVVSQAGAERARRLDRKIVCAWAVGYLTESGMGVSAKDGPRLPTRIEFNLRRGNFHTYLGRPPKAVRSAWCAALNEHGLSAAYTD